MPRLRRHTQGRDACGRLIAVTIVAVAQRAALLFLCTILWSDAFPAIDPTAAPSLPWTLSVEVAVERCTWTDYPSGAAVSRFRVVKRLFREVRGAAGVEREFFVRPPKEEDLPGLYVESSGASARPPSGW